MKITAINQNGIKLLPLHDTIFNGFRFDYSSKSLHLVLYKPSSQTEGFTFNFVNVIGLDATFCDFWGASPHVLSCDPISTHSNSLTQRLYNEKIIHNYDDARISSLDQFIETSFMFISGDRLTISSEYIIIDQLNQLI